MSIKKGDVVRLKSGGPAMTVSEYPVKEAINKNVIVGKVECTWFKEGRQLTHALFNEETLEPVNMDQDEEKFIHT